MISSVLVLPVQAQTTSEFGYQLHPEKLLENTVGTLQIFVVSNEMMVPKQIENLKAVSSDNEIIQILEIEESNDKFTKNISIQAKKPGIATIILAAPGFASKEISIQVFNNNNFPTQILMKITPEKFPIDGPRYGYIALEMATTGGLPTVVTEDTIIHLDTPNSNTIKLKNSEITISAGEYYAITEFEIIGSGDAIIFAETEGMKKISNIVEILEAATPLKLQLYVFPENFNSFSGTRGFAIVQLLDGDGEPVIAEKNINFELGVEDPNISVNTSYDFDEISFDQKHLVIEKGYYSTFTKFSPVPNVGDFTESEQQTYNMFISAEGILTSGDSITVHHDQIGALEGDGPSVTKVLPFLTTGKQEIIAVTYYETNIEVSRQVGGSTLGTTNRETITVTVPVQAKDDHKITFSSSELDTVDPINPTMKKGENVVIVFGETGTVSPKDSVSFYITDNEGVKTVTGNPIGPIEDDIVLIVEPLISMILAEREFPMIMFLEEVEGDDVDTVTTDDEEDEEDARLGVTPFIEDGILTFSVNDYVETNSITIKQNQPYGLMNMMSKEVGSTTLSYQMGGFEGTTSIVSYTTDPALIDLTFPKNVLANSKTLATVQILDSLGNPVYAKKDINIILVSNNEGVLKTEQDLMIKDGDYFTTIEFETFDEGLVELAVLSEDFDLSKFNINVVDIAPVLSLNLIGNMNWNERIEAKLTVSIPEITTALDGFNVAWDVDGGEVVQFDEVTKSNGVATMNVIANDKEQIIISAIVSGNGLSSSTLSETVIILNIPTDELIDKSTPDIEGEPMNINSNLLLMIIIPVVIVAVLFYLKRTDRLDGMMDRLSLRERIDDVKDKISDMRDR